MTETKNKKELSKKIQILLNDMSSGETANSVRAIKSMEAHGSASVIHPMLELWFSNQDAEIDKAMQNFFNDLKESATRVPMMEKLNSTTSHAFRIKMLTSIWNSKVDYSDYLKDFVRLASQGDFLEALECLTVIENLDGPFSEDHFLEAQLYLKDYLEARKESNNHKAEIMSEIAVLLKEFESGQIDL